jgi:uncharacterized membrane protein YfcA
MNINEIIIELSSLHYLSLLLASFMSTLIGSLLGIGGGFIILGLLSVVFPVTIVIPLLAAVLAGIDLSRAFAFRFYLHKPILKPFLVGCSIGVTAGSMLFISLSETVIGTGLAILILLSMTNPGQKINWKLKYPFVWIGAIHSFLSTMFGYGGLLQASIIRTNLGNLQITATLATSFLILELLKVYSYALGGFDYEPYIGVIVITACGAIPASLIGRKLAHRISHESYRSAQKVLIGLIAINLLIKIWT